MVAAAGGKFTAHDSPFIASRPPHVSSSCRLVSLTMLVVFGAVCLRVREIFVLFNSTKLNPKRLPIFGHVSIYRMRWMKVTS